MRTFAYCKFLDSKNKLLFNDYVHENLEIIHNPSSLLGESEISSFKYQFGEKSILFYFFYFISKTLKLSLSDD